MSVDISKINYYSAYNSYKNLGVYPGSIVVTNASIGPGSFFTWSSLISVEPNSRYATASIQTNEFDFISTVTPLRWASFPSATEAWNTLSVDPSGYVALQVMLGLIINNNQVTFTATAFNPGGSSCAFNPFTIGFEYAIHTTDI